VNKQDFYWMGRKP